MALDDFDTACHEAAHAVVASVLGVDVYRVTIEPDDDCKGHVLYDNWSHADPEDHRWAAHHLTLACVRLAGPIADHFRGAAQLSDVFGAGADMGAATVSIESYWKLNCRDGLTESTHAGFMVLLNELTAEIVGVADECIAAVAQALIDKRSLTQNEFESLVEPFNLDDLRVPLLDATFSELRDMAERKNVDVQQLLLRAQSSRTIAR